MDFDWLKNFSAPDDITLGMMRDFMLTTDELKKLIKVVEPKQVRIMYYDAHGMLPDSMTIGEARKREKFRVVIDDGLGDGGTPVKEPELV